MYQEYKKNQHVILSFNCLIVRSVLISTFSLAILALPLLLSVTEEAQAGELFRTQQTLRRQTGLGQRRISKSTKAVKYLNNIRSSKTLDFNSTSPYEARMVAYNSAMRKYDKDLAKWEYKTDLLQAKQDKKLEKDKLKEFAKKKKENEKLAKVAAREHERLERKNRQSSKSSPTSFLARAFGGKESAKDKEESKTVIADEKAKKAEAFFGTVETDTSTVTEVETPTKPKLSFWQRLSRALFGGK